jgi:hypothetical protein
VVCLQRDRDLVGQALWPAVVGPSGEGDQLIAAGSPEGGGSRPALQQLEDGRRAQVVAGQLRRGGIGTEQILAQPVEQPALISCGALVVAGDGPELAGQLAVGQQRPQGGVAVKRQHTANAGVLGVVVLARRPAAPRDQVGVDRQHHNAGVDQPLHQQAVAGLQHHPDLGRVGFQGGDVGQQRLDRGGGVLERRTPITPSPGRPRATR